MRGQVLRPVCVPGPSEAVSTSLPGVALLDSPPSRRYQFNPHLLHPETVTNILVKCLTVFPSPSFSLALALLPPYTTPYALHQSAAASSRPPPHIPSTDFVESVQKLTLLSSLLESAQYANFWATLGSDDLYADLYADVAGFEDLVRIRIAGEVGKTFREVDTAVLSAWLDLRGDSLERFVEKACGWQVEGSKVKVPPNPDNEAKGEVRGERVGVEMFGRVIRRGFEQPA